MADGIRTRGNPNHKTTRQPRSEGNSGHGWTEKAVLTQNTGDKTGTSPCQIRSAVCRLAQRFRQLSTAGMTIADWWLRLVDAATY